MSFEPKILSFLCNWCAYAGADLAGISRFQYPPNTRVIRVMCSGRIDPAFVPRAFLAGFDGVMILGCHPGDCHYLSGNIQAERKMNFFRKLLADEGIGEERLILDWVSAGEGQRFAELVSRFTEQIRSLGPCPLTEDDGRDAAGDSGVPRRREDPLDGGQGPGTAGEGECLRRADGP